MNLNLKTVVIKILLVISVNYSWYKRITNVCVCWITWDDLLRFYWKIYKKKFVSQKLKEEKPYNFDYNKWVI